jgi:heat shock protein HtpX
MTAPRVFIVPDPSLNAFAAGVSPKKSIVGVTQGLLDTMSKSELEAVMGHEISHIRNFDTRVNVAAYAIAFSLLVLGEVLMANRSKNNPFLLLGAILLYVGYPIVLLSRLAISRQREYLADVSSVELTRHPEAMASALEKLKQGVPFHLPSSVSHMFLNTGVKESWWRRIVSTHPPLDQRIKRVRESFSGM